MTPLYHFYICNGSYHLYAAGCFFLTIETWLATHLDPFEKMKNGLLQPLAIDLSTQASGEGSVGSATFTPEAVEPRHKILILHDAAPATGEIFSGREPLPGCSVA